MRGRGLLLVLPLAATRSCVSLILSFPMPCLSSQPSYRSFHRTPFLASPHSIPHFPHTLPLASSHPAPCFFLAFLKPPDVPALQLPPHPAPYPAPRVPHTLAADVPSLQLVPPCHDGQLLQPQRTATGRALQVCKLLGWRRGRGRGRGTGFISEEHKREVNVGWSSCSVPTLCRWTGPAGVWRVGQGGGRKAKGGRIG